MIKVKIIYNPNNTELTRLIQNTDSIPLIVGQMLYGIKVQGNDFDVDNVFRSLNLPDKYNKNTTIINDDTWKITISAVRHKEA